MTSPSGTTVEQFGDYQLTRYLATGGMADLYLARGPGGGDEVVLKRIQQRFVGHTHIVKLFIDEGRIAKTLDHPNIVRTLDVGQLEGTYFIVMEYIPGHDLIAIARRGMETGRFLPRAIAVGVVAQAASGLAYAHQNRGSDGKPLSIVHCDISPGNIVVSWRGTAKIVDFGIARAAIQLRAEDGVAGKFNYMAPEQIRAEKVDARADLFSLGVILYELTLGKRLFKGKPAQVRHKVLEGSIPRPRDVVPDFPQTLEGILGRLLARDPGQRYPSALDLLDDLKSYLRDEETGFDKREIARYMRQLFHAELRPGGDPEFEEPSDETAMPALSDEEIESDADELFDVEPPEPDPAPRDGVTVRQRIDELPGPIAPPDQSDQSDQANPIDDATPTDGTVAPPVVEELEPPPLEPIAEAVRAHVERRADEARQQSVSGQMAGREARGNDEPAVGQRKVQVEPDPTTRVRLPPQGQADATALVRMPDGDGRRSGDRQRARSTEITKSSQARRGRPSTIQLSTGVVVGSCMLIAALLMFIVILVSR